MQQKSGVGNVEKAALTAAGRFGKKQYFVRKM